VLKEKSDDKISIEIINNELERNELTDHFMLLRQHIENQARIEKIALRLIWLGQILFQSIKIRVQVS
jgi:hypothetical protein